jgi:hypothetical protein
MRGPWAILAVVLVLAGTPQAAQSDVQALFNLADRDGRVGVARKTNPVDMRPAEPGEVVVTVIAGEGKETQSPPAKPGDMGVRNRCPETGNEEIPVSATKFADRYEGPIGPADATGWRAYRPCGVEMQYFVVHLPGTVGRAHGGAARRRHRARRPGGHLWHRRSRVHVRRR